MKSVGATAAVAMSIETENQGTKHCPDNKDDEVWNFDSISKDGSDSETDSYSDSDTSSSDRSMNAANAFPTVMPHIASRGIILPQHLQSQKSAVALAALNQHLQSQGPANPMTMVRQRSQAELAAVAAAIRGGQVPNLNLQLNHNKFVQAQPGYPVAANVNPKLLQLQQQLRANGKNVSLEDLIQHIQSRRAKAAVVILAQQEQQQQQQHQRLKASSASTTNLSMVRDLEIQNAAQTGKRNYRRVESACAFQSVAHQARKKFKRSKSEHFSSTTPKDKQNEEKSEKKKAVKPEEHLRALLQKRDLDLSKFSVSKDTFLPNTKEQTEDYPEAAQAARDENLEVLQKLHAQGKNLQSANVYGESIIHIVCRRGNYALFDFLTQKAKVSIRVRDDIGRTPLHDAAWTDKPNFELVETILRQEPDLLFAQDQRGSSPLAYVPPNRWPLWCKFLDDQPELIQLALDSEKTTKAT